MIPTLGNRIRHTNKHEAVEEGEVRTFYSEKLSRSVPEASDQEGLCGGKRLQAAGVAIQGEN